MCSNYYLPLFGLLVGFFTVLITLFAIKAMIVSQLDIDGVFGKQMDGMVEGFKKQIPMANSLISEALTEKLKQFGLIEMGKVTPLIKQKIAYSLYKASAVLLGIGSLFGLFMGLLYWWICGQKST